MLKSRKTTVAGVAAGLGLLLSLASKLLAEGGPGLLAVFQPEYAAELLAAVGAAFIGLFARDDNVTSEGTKAPKNVAAPTSRPPFR
jgi:hypothetical protein